MPVERSDAGDDRAAFGEGARLVEYQTIDLGRRFQTRAAFDQHAVARQPPNRGDHGRGRGQNQRARTGHQQDRYRPHPIAGEVERRRGGYGQQRQKPFRVTVGQPNDRRSFFFGGFNQSDDPGQRGFFTDARGADFQRARRVDASGEDRIAGRLVSGQRFTCNRRLVDRRGAGDDHAVHRQSFTGTNNDDVARRDFGDFDFALIVTAGVGDFDTSGFWREINQLLNGRARAARGVLFQTFADQHDEDRLGGREIFADGQRGDDCQRDGHFRGDALFQQRRDRVVENPPPADQRQPDACVDAPQLSKHAQPVEQQQHADSGCEQNVSGPFAGVGLLQVFWRDVLEDDHLLFFAEFRSPIHTGETHAASPSICTTRR